MSIKALRRFPGGLLGTLALIFFVEGFIGDHGQIFRHPWAWDWFLADRASRQKVKDCEVLCFGDSLMKFGVAPRMIEHGSGWKTYNLAVGVGQAPSSFFLLRRSLESGAHPKAILIDTVPHMLAATPGANARLWPDLLSYRDCFELSLMAGDSHFLASMTLAKLFPSIRDRMEIRQAFTASLRGEPAPISQGLPAILRNWNANQGAALVKRAPTPVPNQVEAWAADLFPDSWSPSSLNTYYLHKFFQLASSNGIQVYWLIPPFSPEVQVRREAKGRDEEFIAFVKSIQARYPGVVVLDARHSGYGEDSHVDPIHLDIRGASSLSRDLAAILRREPASLSRWEVMPTFRDIPSEVALEDALQSAEVVRNRSRK